jgi:hypothetical protein
VDEQSAIERNLAASRELGERMDRAADVVVDGLRRAARSGRYRSRAARTGRHVARRDTSSRTQTTRR